MFPGVWLNLLRPAFVCCLIEAIWIEILRSKREVQGRWVGIKKKDFLPIKFRSVCACSVRVDFNGPYASVNDTEFIYSTKQVKSAVIGFF